MGKRSGRGPAAAHHPHHMLIPQSPRPPPRHARISSRKEQGGGGEGACLWPVASILVALWPVALLGQNVAGSFLTAAPTVL